MAGDLGRRVGVAVVGIPVVLACLALGGWALGGLIALAAAGGAWEFFRLARARGEAPFDGVGVAAAAVLVLLAVGRSGGALAGAAFPMLVALTLGLLGAAVWLRWPDGRPMGAVSTTLAGVLYVGGGLAFVPLLRGVPDALGAAAPWWVASGLVLLPLLAVWAGDSAAYFVGRAFGRHKLAPHASPQKSWEGAVAGLVGSGLAGAAVGAWALAPLGVFEAPALTGAWMAALIGAAGQVGDLAESVLKREAGVKDSGSLLPGHGGVLDRIDALLPAFPVTWALLALFGVVGGAP